MASILVAADLGGVASARHLEIPIVGPGRANLLVVANGVALPELTTDEVLGTEETTPIDFLIDTDYKLRDNDVLIDSSAYVTLSSIDADDSTDFLLALDSTEVKVRTSKVIQLKASGAVGGDAGLHRIGYQVNLLVMRTG
jgi:hypothetical protein